MHSPPAGAGGPTLGWREAGKVGTEWQRVVYHPLLKTDNIHFAFCFTIEGLDKELEKKTTVSRPVHGVILLSLQLLSIVKICQENQAVTASLLPVQCIHIFCGGYCSYWLDFIFLSTCVALQVSPEKSV